MAKKIPEFFVSFVRDYPACAAAYEALGAASREAAGLSTRETALVKLALALGASLEGASHAHARRSLALGASADELRGVALSGLTTLGFPTTMRNLAWVEDVVGSRKKGAKGGKGGKGEVAAKKMKKARKA